jgi:hypothetical protein
MKTARLAGLHIALAAMLLRAFLPDGWMPAPRAHADNGGWLSLVICTSNGLARIHEPQHGSHGKDVDHRFAPCPYAASAHLGTPEASAAAMLYEAAYVAVRFIGGEERPADDIPFRHRQSRAPPVLKI